MYFGEARGILEKGCVIWVASATPFPSARPGNHLGKNIGLNNDAFVEGLRHQEPAAARHLNECYVPVVWRFVYHRVNLDRHLAEDIVSESVLALVRAIGKGDEIEFPSAWLRQVATRRIQDHFRAAARVAHLMEHAIETASHETTETPSSQHDTKLKRQEVRDVLDQLADPSRLALEWKYVDGLSVRVIADRLAVTEKSAESILFRARKKFKEHMQSHSDASRSRVVEAPPNLTNCESQTITPQPIKPPESKHQPPSDEMMRTSS